MERISSIYLTRDLPLILTLWGFAVAQPLYDLLAQYPTFLTAHGLDLFDGVVLILCLSIAIPALLAAVLSVVHLRSPQLGQLPRLVLSVLLAGALAAAIAWRVDTGWLLQTIIAIAITLVVVLLVLRAPIALTLLRVMGPATLLFPVLFLANPQVYLSMQAPWAELSYEPRKTPNIVFVVFDELPTMALTAGTRNLQQTLWPGFAQLASRATWYRNTSAVSTHTELALPAILSGVHPSDRTVVAGAGPDAKSFPQNLFALLAPHYNLVVSEPVTGLCPTSRCTHTRTATQSPVQIVVDLSLIFAHTVTPPVWRDALPDISEQWGGFAFGQLHQQAVRAIGLNRHHEVNNFIQAIKPGPEPSLYFGHFTLPHSPYQYAPSGEYVFRHQPQRSVEKIDGVDHVTTRPAAHRELQVLFYWQMKYVDKIVSDLLNTITQSGMTDNTVLIITADHGVSLTPGTKRRRLHEENIRDIMSVPLFVVTPHDTSSSINDNNFSSADILALLAAELGTALPWGSDGLAGHKRVQDMSKTHTFAADAALATTEDASRWTWLHDIDQTRPFSPPTGTFQPPEPLSDQISDQTSDQKSASITNERIYTKVNPRTFIPMLIRGRLQEPVQPQEQVTVVVNATHALETLVYNHDGSSHFTAFAHNSLQPGFNRVQVVSQLDGKVRYLYDNKPSP